MLYVSIGASLLLGALYIGVDHGLMLGYMALGATSILGGMFVTYIRHRARSEAEPQSAR